MLNRVMPGTNGNDASQPRSLSTIRRPSGHVVGHGPTFTGIAADVVELERAVTTLGLDGAMLERQDLRRDARGVHVSVAPADLATTGAALATHPEVTFAAATTGRTSLYASVMTPDTQTLYNYLTNAIAALPPIRDIESTLVIHSLKSLG